MSRTREQRRRLRRRVLRLAALCAMAITLAIMIRIAIGYGMYVQQLIDRSRDNLTTAQATYLPRLLDGGAFDDALLRHEQEQDPWLFDLLYGQKKSADQLALVDAVLRAEP